MTFYRKLASFSSLLTVASLSLGIAGAAVGLTIALEASRAYNLLGEVRWVNLMEVNEERGFRFWPEARLLHDWRDGLDCCDRMGGYSVGTADVRTEEGNQAFLAARVEPVVFEVVGSPPVVGRFLSPDDPADRVLISSAFARRTFGSPAKALGGSLTVDGAPVRVVGVFDRDLSSALSRQGPLDLLRPFEPGALEKDGAHAMVLARLGAGVTPDAARAELGAWSLARLDSGEADAEMQTAWTALSRRDELDPATERTLKAVWAVAFLLLLTGGATAALLLAARWEEQRSELAVRWALGASRYRLLAGRVGRALLWTAAGAVPAALLSRAAFAAVGPLLPFQLRFLQDVEAGLPAVGAASALCWLVLALLAAAPLLRRSAETWLGDLRTGQSVSGMRRLGSSLHLVFLVSLSFVLGVMAYLILTSARNLREHDVGFDAAGLQMVELTFPEWKFSDAEQRRRLGEDLSARLDALPSTASAGWASQVAPEVGVLFAEVEAEAGVTSLPNEMLGFSRVSPGYFHTLRQPLVAGRGFTPGDAGSDEPVLVVSEAVARLLEAKPEQLVGTRLRIGDEQHTVVGVAADLDMPGLPQLLAGKMLYFPMEDFPAAATLLVRTDAPIAGEARRTARALDADLGIEVLPLTEHLADSVNGIRLMVSILTAGSSLALLLTLAALYGALARFVTSQRLHVGLRMTLGADRGDIARWVGSRAFRVFAAGAVLGWLASYPLGRLVAGQLFEVPPDTLPARLAAVFIVASAIVAAAWIPALRAGRTDPAEVLRDA